MYSYLIRGATMVDGSGQPPFRADVAIEGERIAAIAPGSTGRQISRFRPMDSWLLRASSTSIPIRMPRSLSTLWRNKTIRGDR